MFNHVIKQTMRFLIVQSNTHVLRMRKDTASTGQQIIKLKIQPMPPYLHLASYQLECIKEPLLLDMLISKEKRGTVIKAEKDTGCRKRLWKLSPGTRRRRLDG